MEKLSLKLDSGRISYIKEGHGPPLLLLHSLGVSSEAWNKVLPSLAQRYTVYAPDMLGHADSDKPPGNYRIEDYARSVVAFMDKLGLGKIVLCGNSVGGLITLEIAVTNAERIEKLVLVGCPSWEAWQRIERLMLSALGFDIEGNPLPLSLEQLALTYVRTTPELLEWVNQQRGKADIWIKKTMIAIGLYDAIPKLPLVKCPTLVLFGSKDMLREHEKTLLEGIKGAKHALVPNAGHLPQIDNPQSFLQEVNQFLTSGE
ncbi:alpha/beta fold hydrolase [Chloroflexota bacterium]